MHAQVEVSAEINQECQASIGSGCKPVRDFLQTVRYVGPKVAAGIADQGLTSGGSAVVNFVLAAWLSAADYGVFSLGSTLFLIAAGFHNSLILEPVSVLGASRFLRDIRVYLRQVFFGQIVVSVAASTLLAAIAAFVPMSNGPRIALLGAAILCPPLLTVWYLRRIQYLSGTPHRAARIAAVYATALVVFFAIAKHQGRLSPLIGLALMSAAAVTACLTALGSLRERGAEPSFRSMVTAHWRFGKWFIAAPFLAVGTNQIQVLMVASCLGMAGTGALRATMNFAMPLVQLVTALSNLALPSLAQRYSQNPATFKRAAWKLMLLYGTGGLVYMLALSVFGGRLETVIYGDKFSVGTETFLVLGAWIFAVCVSNASGVALRAQQNPKACLAALFAASAFGFLSAKPLVLAYGVCGAAISMAGTYAVSAIVQTLVFYMSGQPSGAPQLGESPA